GGHRHRLALGGGGRQLAALVAGLREERRGDAGGQRPVPRDRAAAELLGQHGELDDAPTLAPVLLVEPDARPALANRQRVGLGEVAALGPLAYGGERRLAGGDPRNGVAQELLLVGEINPHRVRL